MQRVWGEFCLWSVFVCGMLFWIDIESEFFRVILLLFRIFLLNRLVSVFSISPCLGSDPWVLSWKNSHYLESFINSWELRNTVGSVDQLLNMCLTNKKWLRVEVNVEKVLTPSEKEKSQNRNIAKTLFKSCIPKHYQGNWLIVYLLLT